ARFRYAWQDNDVEVVIGEHPLDEPTLAAAVASFHDQHLFEFGHADPAEKVELVSIGVGARWMLKRPAAEALPEPVDTVATPDATRQVYSRETGWSETPVFQRENLQPGATFAGPAIVEERE